MDAPKKWHDKIQLWIAIGSLLIAILSISIQLRTKIRELSCNVVSSSELTSVSQIPGLTSSFAYRGTPVTHLWKVALLFVNTGNETLIGEGAHASLIGDAIQIGFTNRAEILNVEPEVEQNGFKFEKQSTNSFKLKFDQWLPDEKASIIVYLTSQDDLPQPIMPTPLSRDIADGKVIVRNATQLVPSKPPATIEKFPAILRIPSKWLMGFFAAIFMIVGFFGIPLGIRSFIRQSRWKKKYLASFSEFVKSQNLFFTDRIIAKPGSLPVELWKNFKGEKYPDGSFELGDSLGEVLAAAVFLIVIGIAGAVYVLAFLGDLFPSLAAHF